MADINTIEIEEAALRLVKNTKNFKKRFFLSKIEVGKEPRIKVLRGFRGVGKTTALLQLMKEGAIYFSMDNAYVRLYSLYELGKRFILDGNTTILIDEIHHYKKWKEDTKSLYDEFPNISIIVSGSAPLAFEPERRYEVIEVEPLSIREFAWLDGRNVEQTDAWADMNTTVKFLAERPSLYEVYKNYLDGGALPVYFSYREKTLQSIYNSIRKSIVEDATFLPRVDGEMIVSMDKVLTFLATSSLGEFSIHSLSKHLEISKNKTYYLISLLGSMKILRVVRPYGKGAKLIRGDPKLMFYHPIMRKAICNEIGMQVNEGALKEEMAVFCLRARGWNVSTIKGMKKDPDYIVERGKKRIVIEIGGISKIKEQLKGFEEKTLVIGDKQLILLGLF